MMRRPSSLLDSHPRARRATLRSRMSILPMRSVSKISKAFLASLSNVWFNSFRSIFIFAGQQKSLKMAGSIQRVIPNTLSYSCDFSSPFNSHHSDGRSSSGSLDDQSSCSGSSLVFDLRDDIETESVGNTLQLHELNNSSESVLVLEASPDEITVLPSCEHPVAPPKRSPPDPVYESKPVRVSDLVDCLVGPTFMPTLSRKSVRSQHSTKPSSAATSAVSTPKENTPKPVLTALVPKVFPVGRTPPKKSSRRVHRSTPPEQPKPLSTRTEKHDAPFVPFGQVMPKSNKTRSTFTCPDGWIPNHQCDDFCYSLFSSNSRTSPSTRARQQSFVPFSN